MAKRSQATDRVQPRNFTDCAAMADFDIVAHHNAVVNGKPPGMPAWGGKLTNEEIWQVTMYERSPCELYPTLP